MLKIIAGRHKGRTFTVPSASETLRPTLGRVRQRIFDLLGPFPSSSWVMDGFSGTGALGLEALSRGAA
ncbi:MAG: RsmD family RNA methyltransferase, partial [Holosporales bacterium]|nr:RsmD family RNA methyltransferase [Holosporales bacterium]